MRLRPARILRFVGVAFLLYLAFLLPWRYGVEGYVRAVAPAAQGLMRLADSQVDIAGVAHRLRHARLFPELRVAARDDMRQSPFVTRWLLTLAPSLARDIYAVERTRAFVLVEYRDFYRLTLELPLFLALIIALPRIPWRRRLRPLLLGLGALFVVHVSLALSAGFWVSARVGHMRVEGLAIVDTVPDFWNDLVNRYQYLGPGFALLLLVGLLFLRAFDPAD